MDWREPPIANGGNATPQYSDVEERVLLANLWSIDRHVRRGTYRERPLSVDLICELHRDLFENVRGHAGRHRAQDFGSEALTYGPNRSLHRDDVEAALEHVVEKAEPLIRALLADPGQDEYERKALHISTWVHAEVIRIHPFEDGNGRTSRALLDAVLVRLGLRPIAWEAPKEEYQEALNHYFKTGDFEPLADMVLALYVEQLS